ncbi:hypothetical protein CSAL01_00541 [Colletotrichum salicis]|uniref:NmrA-like domain-containing protein n=1 Tax=Colletotrichum salicis TaxID=1209931 RepID=A0A135UPR3_9PEZI|nr:hypothetical protein CSAL01_00541 [Colletotrichum salicis]
MSRHDMFGAAGESGGTIVDGLLKSTSPSFVSSCLKQRHFAKFLLPTARITDTLAKEVAALARPSSISKPAYGKLRERGVDVVIINLDKPETEIANVLKGFQILIASVHPAGIGSQVALVRAAKVAGVQRFIPSAFAMAYVKKEEVYAKLRAINLPYTIIDVGWCDGNMPTHAVDYPDIGKLIARIIVDPRTISQKITASSATMSFNEMFAIAEELSGETVVRKEGLQSMIADFDAQLQKNPQYALAAIGKFCSEYYYSSFINGDNSPEGVSRLGYLLATDLYPDFQSTPFQDFFLEVLKGKAGPSWSLACQAEHENCIKLYLGTMMAEVETSDTTLGKAMAKFISY